MMSTARGADAQNYNHKHRSGNAKLHQRQRKRTGYGAKRARRGLIYVFAIPIGKAVYVFCCGAEKKPRRSKNIQVKIC